MQRLAILAHYDAKNRIRRHTVHYLRALREVADNVAFVSTSKLPSSETDKLGDLCNNVWQLQNVGFDFGMWRYAIERLELSGVDELVLTNSSVIGPVTPLEGAFAKMAREACDFWAMTDNAEIAWHLQSYFMVFRRGAFTSSCFREFFGSVLGYRNKDQVIRSYEVGLTVYLAERGLRPKALVPFTDVVPKRRQDPKRTRTNTTCCYPLRLLQLGMPFVKVELLRDNPAHVPLKPVHAFLANAGYDADLIELDKTEVR